MLTKFQKAVKNARLASFTAALLGITAIVVSLWIFFLYGQRLKNMETTKQEAAVAASLKEGIEAAVYMMLPAFSVILITSGGSTFRALKYHSILSTALELSPTRDFRNDESKARMIAAVSLGLATLTLIACFFVFLRYGKPLKVTNFTKQEGELVSGLVNTMEKLCYLMLPGYGLLLIFCGMGTIFALNRLTNQRDPQ